MEEIFGEIKRHAYLIQRLNDKAEEYGIKTTQVSEVHSSSLCPRCGSRDVLKRKRLFQCLDCGLEAHCDAVGCVNMGLAQGEPLPAGDINRVVARPLLLSLEA